MTTSHRQEQHYDVEEMFYSSTAPNSKIVSFNEVFYRVSEYTPEEMLGKPHNLIRNTDVPKAVFKIFWDYIQNGKIIIAYVNNQTKTGRYYWVLACVIPILNESGKITRYVSTRLKPTSDFFQKNIPDLYAQVLQHEQNQGMESAENHLYHSLQSHGFPDYDSFMRFALQSEIISRQQIISSRTTPLIGLPELSQLGEPLRTQITTSDNLSLQYRKLMRNLDKTQKDAQQLGEFTNLVRRVSDDIQLLAFNSLVVAAKAKEYGRTFFVIADTMGQFSKSIREASQKIFAGIEELNTLTSQLLFNLMLVSVKTDMTRNLFIEHLTFRTSLKDVSLLLNVISNSESECRSTFGRLEAQTYQVNKRIGDIEQIVLQIEMLSAVGGITTAELGEVGRECNLLVKDIKSIIGGAKEEVSKVKELATTIFHELREQIESYNQTLVSYKKLVSNQQN